MVLKSAIFMLSSMCPARIRGLDQHQQITENGTRIGGDWVRCQRKIGTNYETKMGKLTSLLTGAAVCELEVELESFWRARECPNVTPKKSG